MQPAPAPPQRTTIDAVFAEAHATFDRVLPRVALLALVFGALNVDWSGNQTVDLGFSPVTLAILIIGGSLAGGLTFGAWVWGLRSAGGALGHPQTESPGIAPTLLTGIIATALILVGCLALLVPGLIAMVLLALVAPVVAYEGLTNWAAIQRSTALVRANVGTIVVVCLSLLVVPELLDPTMWTGATPTFTTGLWNMLVGAASFVYGTALTAAAWRQSSLTTTPGLTLA